MEITCTYGLSAPPAGQGSDPAKSLLISTTIVPDQAALDSLGLPRLMMSPEPVAGMGKAWYSTNLLSGTTEYVLEIQDGLRVTRLTLAAPAAATPGPDVKTKLAELARLP
ncbi:hypothetical protein [Pseudarthrobacter sp. PH31-O2]|uniref:hypothetical protein n=1 Tax=Pseudarthrobacter sp. PH31-O2 TaxID=3046206 RepID=UPI0024B8F099|nr:hypothetical protein [Pseudarthrobacter sp. PH31-O2]MDJ0351157.1 hypothetical protein [Pseudarthrobacter sp. PH31-O2]